MAHEVALRSTALILSEKEIRNYAAAFAASNMFKAGGNKMTPDQALVCIMAGQEFGWGPFAAMTNLNVIEGRPELSADAQARFIKASGKYDFRVTAHTNDLCEITVLAVPSGEIIAVERYTMDDAERQELTKLTSNGRKTNWHKAPRNMLFARCISNVTAFHCQDAVPMRTYAQGEIMGEHRLEEEPREFTDVEAAELQAIEAQVTAQVVRNRNNGEGADVREEPGYVCVLEEGEVPPDDAEPADWRERPDVMGVPDGPSAPPEAEDPAYARFIEDVQTLNEGEKNLIRDVLRERGVAFKTSEIVKMLRESGFSDIRSWLSATALPAGFVSRETGRQTAVKTISDAQLGMLHARVSEIGLTDEEYRKMLMRYCGVSGGREVPAADFNDLLAVIGDIKEIPPEDVERRAAYL